MRVLVAGATGAIGRPLVRRLLADGHDVTGLSRRAEGVQWLGSVGAKGRQVDVLDAKAVDAVVADVRPHAVVAELTELPKTFAPRRLKQAYARNNAVREHGTGNLVAAAETHGVERFVAQGSAFWYAPTPGAVKTEADPLWLDAPEPIGEAVRAMQRTEDRVLSARAVSPLVLRYATFYGPGTWFSVDGTVGKLLQKRQYPIIGRGDAVLSFVHIDDAADATARALGTDTVGVLNVSDDEPAAANDWQPALAAAVGAPAPAHVPPWVAALLVGRSLVDYSLETRGAANGAVRDALDWVPRFPSWRDGFQKGLR